MPITLQYGKIAIARLNQKTPVGSLTISFNSISRDKLDTPNSCLNNFVG
jgi:hypothetical protein